MMKKNTTFGFADASLLDTLSPEIRPVAPATSLAGHRERMRSRLLSAGAEAVADHELIEMILFLALPRRDTKAIARLLIARFGSYAATISASVPDLLTVEGLGEAGVAAIKIVQAAAQRLSKAEVLYRPVLSNWDRLM
jgi:DNA repair protein RadC